MSRNDLGVWMGAAILVIAIAATADATAITPGDMNCDGIVDEGDVQPFLLAVNDPSAYMATYPNCDISHGDINGDQTVDARDYPPFLALARGPIPAPALSPAGLAGALLVMGLVALRGARDRSRSRCGSP